MATDIAKVIANLASFYDFSNKSVVPVGAGGGQFIGYASDARHVVAVDPDTAALGPFVPQSASWAWATDSRSASRGSNREPSR